MVTSTAKQQQPRLSCEVFCTGLGNAIQCFGENPSFLHLLKCFPPALKQFFLSSAQGMDLAQERHLWGEVTPNLPAPGLFDNSERGIEQGPHLSHLYQLENQ